MKTLMFLLAFGLASSDKLDRTYLPPPGSKVAGGSDGAIQVPFEVPQQAYSTTLRPLLPGQKDTTLNPGDTVATVEINRGISEQNIFTPGPQDFVSVTPGPSYDYNLSKVPTTTTTYAFTQTTIFPPTSGFETTANPTVSTDFSSNISGNIPSSFQPLNQNQGIPQLSGLGYIQPNFSAVQNPILNQPLSYQIPNGPLANQPGYGPQTTGQYFPNLNSVSFTPGNVQGFQPAPQHVLSQHFGSQPTVQYGQPVHTTTFVPQQPVQTIEPGVGTIIPGAFPQGTAIIQSGLPQTTLQPGIPYNQKNIAPISQELGGQRPLFFGQPGPSPPSVTQFQTPGSNLSQNPIQQPTFFNPQQDRFTPTSITIPQPITFPQSQILLKNSQQNVYGPVKNEEQGYYYPKPGSQVNHSPAAQQYQVNVPQDITPGIQSNFSEKQFILPYQGIVSSTASPHVQSYQPGASITSSQDNVQSYQRGLSPASSQLNVTPLDFVPTTNNPSISLGSVQPGVKSSGGFQESAYTQPNIFHKSQQDLEGNVPESGIYSGGPSQIIPGQLSPTSVTPSWQISVQNQVPGSTMPQQIGESDRYRPSQQIVGPNQYRPNSSTAAPNAPTSFNQFSGPRTYNTDSTSPFSIKPSTYSQPSYPSTTPGNLNTFSPTLSSFPVTSTTPFPSLITSENRRLNPERPQAESDRNAEILNYKNILSPDGSFEYSFDTSNGIHADENGTSVDGVKAQGSYSYIGDDGKLYSVVYTADKNGFRPNGDHLPTPPPIPEAIQKVIEQANRDKEAGISHDGFYDEEKYGDKKYQTMKEKRPNQKSMITATQKPYYDEHNFDSNQAKITPKNRVPSRVRPDQIRPNPYDEKDKYLVQNQTPGQSSDKKQFEQDRQIVSSTRKPTGFKNEDEIQLIPGSTQTFDQSFKQPETLEYPKYDAETENYFNEDRRNEKGMNNDFPIADNGDKYFSEYEQQMPARNDKHRYTVTRRPVASTTSSSYPGEKEYFPSRSGVDRTKQRPKKPVSGNVQFENSSDFYAREGPFSETVTPKQQGFRRPNSQFTKNIDQRQKLEQPETSQGQIYDNKDNVYDYEEENGAKKPSKTEFSPPFGNKKSGYEYLPPKNLQDREFATQLSPKAGQDSAIIRQSTKKEFDLNASAQPFITPNVHNDEQTTYDDEIQYSISSNMPIKKPGAIASIHDVFESTDNPKYNEYETDLEIGDEHNFPVRFHPWKPSTEYTTEELDYEEEYEVTNDKKTQKPLRPSQDKYSVASNTPGSLKEEIQKLKRPVYPTSVPTVSSTRGTTTAQPQSKQTYNGSDLSTTADYPDQFFPSSTTGPKIKPVYKPRPTYSDDNQESDIMSRPMDIKPGYKYGDRTAVSRRPVVLKPSNKLGYKTNESTESKQYGPSTTQPGTFDQNRRVPSKPSTYYPGQLTPGSGTVRPGDRINGRPSIQNVPSTTYRPGYIIDKVTGRPTAADFSRTPAGSDGTDNDTDTDQAGPENIPRGSVFQDTARTKESKFDADSPGSGNQRYGYPGVTSTTERIIGEDFSGPRQPQSYDSKTGYHY